MSHQSLISRLPKLGRFHLLFTCLLVVGAGNSMLLAILPPLARRLSLPDSSIGWIFSLSALLWVLTSPYWGRVSDRVGRKPMVTAGLIAYAISMGSFALVVSAGLVGFLQGFLLFLAMMLARAIFGGFGSSSSPAAQAYIADHTTRWERTEHLAGLTAAFALGQAIGPGVTSLLAANFGMVFPIALTAVLAALAAFAIWRFLPEPNFKPMTAEDGEPEGPQSWQLARDPRLAPYLVYGLGLSIVTGTLTQVFALYVMDRLHVQGGAGAAAAATGFMANALALLFTQMVLLKQINLSTRALMASGAGLVALGVAVQIFAPTQEVLVLSQVIQGLGFGLARPGFAGGSSMAVKPHEQGGAAGLVVAINGAGFVLSPVTGGVAYEQLGMDAPMVICLAVLIAMLAYAWLHRGLRDKPTIDNAQDAGLNA